MKKERYNEQKKKKTGEAERERARETETGDYASTCIITTLTR